MDWCNILGDDRDTESMDVSKEMNNNFFSRADAMIWKRQLHFPIARSPDDQAKDCRVNRQR